MTKQIKSLLLVTTGFSLGYIAAPNPQTLDEYYTENDFKLAKVIDGDTLHVSRIQGEVIKVRLHGIDTPERGAAYFQPAKQALIDLCREQTIRLNDSRTDSFGRITARVNCGGVDINTALLESGAAIVSIKYADDDRFYALQDIARNNCRGVWSQDLGLNYADEKLTGKSFDGQVQHLTAEQSCTIKTVQNARKNLNLKRKIEVR